MPLLEIKDVAIAFGGLNALSGFSFSLDQGQTVALIGPNGAGKTTAFNIVTGVYRPTKGSIQLDGKQIAGLVQKPHRLARADAFRHGYEAFSGRAYAIHYTRCCCTRNHR